MVFKKIISSFGKANQEVSSFRVQSGHSSTGTNAAYDPNWVSIGRHAIVNNYGDVAAWELLFRDAGETDEALFTDGIRATSNVLLNAIHHFGLDNLAGEVPLFINVPLEMLDSPIFEILPSRRLVLDMPFDFTPTATVVKRCNQLKRMGYRISLSGFTYHEAMESMLAIADYVKLDLADLGHKEMSRQVNKLRGRGLRIVGEKIESVEDYDAGRSMHMNYYQGYHFSKPETLKIKRVEPDLQRLMHITNLVLNQAEQDMIEWQFKQDVSLYIGLLRFVNSLEDMPEGKPITVRLAIKTLGYEKISRWLSLVMMNCREDLAVDRETYKKSLYRAHLVEHLGRNKVLAREQEFLFMVGLFSMFDVLLEENIEQVLTEFKLGEEVSEALLDYSWPYGPFLTLAEAIENKDAVRIDQLRADIDLSAAEVKEANQFAGELSSQAYL